jgi:PadR family transcriptional regulator, regulatory protein AphA
MLKQPIAIEHALLGLLHDKPMHGYELYQQVREPAGLWLIWRMKQSQLYALLARLEEEGYLVTELQPQATRPPRKIFHLTAAGLQAYQAWLASPVTHGRSMRQEFLAKLYCARQAGDETARQLIQRQRAECEYWRTLQVAQCKAQDESPTFAALVLSFRTHQIEALLVWLDACEQLLAATPTSR